MKRSLVGVLSIALMCLCMFVSCSGEAKEPGSARIVFSSVNGIGNSRKVEAAYDNMVKLDTLYWYVQGVRQDGTQSDSSFYKVGGENDKGIIGKACDHKFSAGKYTFTVYGYSALRTGTETDNNKNLVYKGTSDEITLKSGDNNNVNVVVKAYQEMGTLKFGTLGFAYETQEGVTHSGTPVVKITLTNSANASKSYTFTTNTTEISGNKSTVTVNNIDTNSNGASFDSTKTAATLPVGTYKVTFVVNSSSTDDTALSLSSNSSTTLKIFGNAETTLEGTIEETKDSKIKFDNGSVTISKNDAGTYNPDSGSQEA